MPVTAPALAAMARSYTDAWNTLDPAAVAAHYAPDGQIIINNGTPWTGRDGIAAMAAGFYADVPDLTLACDDIRLAGTHAVYVWTFTGHHSGTKRPLKIHGCEEWEMTEDLTVKSSRGWYDAADYAVQVGGR